MRIIHPKMILDLPPGGLCTFTDVLASVGCLLSWRGCPTIGFEVGAFLAGRGFVGTSQPREKLLFPPGAW